MKWINKNTHRAEADKTVKEYLDNYCIQSDGRYRNVQYDSNRDGGTGPCFCKANSGSYRKRLTKILLDNQDGYCCYCMRKIKTAQREEYSDEVVTREHIIPRGFTNANLAKVMSYYQQSPELSPNNVILTDVFEHPTHNQSADFPPYPHKVAYSNLVASCNGTFPYIRNDKENKPKICCNEFRLEKDAFPIYFMRDIETYIHYLPNGDIHAKTYIPQDIQDKINDVIINANLDCAPLKEIRRLWYILSHVPKERIYNCRTKEQRDYLLSEMLYKNEFFVDGNVELHEKFKKEVFWDTFMLYDYFYEVYNRL